MSFVGELQGDGISEAECAFLLGEVRKPMCAEKTVRAVPDPQVAAQVYIASPLAVGANTPAEKEYLSGLARDLKLESSVSRSCSARSDSIDPHESTDN
jgi:uncharacterized membrane protein YebE (DUF533 family)